MVLGRCLPCATAVDKIDLQLLRELSLRGRTTSVELADAVHLSTSAVARRQKALEDAGLIKGYRASLDLTQFGFCTTVVVQIALSTQKEAGLEEFERAVQACGNVLRCMLMSGSNDYLLILLVRDLQDFERVHKTQLSRLPNVARIESSFALREVVSRSVPLEVFDRS